MLRTTLQLGFTKGAMLFAAALEHKWALTNLALGEACNYIGGLQDAAQGIWNKVRVGRAVGRGVRDKAVKAAGGTGNGAPDLSLGSNWRKNRCGSPTQVSSQNGWVRGSTRKTPVELPFKHGSGLTGLGIKNMECDKV